MRRVIEIKENDGKLKNTYYQHFTTTTNELDKTSEAISEFNAI